MKEYKQVTSELIRQNNPQGKPSGDFTGRCPKCQSNDLWDDNLHYGCNCCGYIKLATNV